jgi:hypothetical protein
LLAFSLCSLLYFLLFETVSEAQSSGVVLGPETMTGRNNSIETRVNITATRFTTHPKMKSDIKMLDESDSGETELIKKSIEASKTAINEAINIRLDAR